MNPIKKQIEKLKAMDKRSIQVLVNVAGSFLIKGGSLIVTMLIVPAYFRYFEDKVVLGVWYTGVSIINWMLNFDLGIGNGLRNYMVGPLVKGDIPNTRKYISSAYVMSFLVSILALLAAFIAVPRLNWNAIFNVPDELISGSILVEMVLIIFVGIALQLFLKLISSILYAMQKAALPNALGLLSSFMILAYVLFAKTDDLRTNILSLAWMNVIAVNLPLLIASLVVFATKLKSCIPSFRFFDKPKALEVLRTGGTFLWLQIMFMLIINSNEFLISLLSDPGNTTDFTVYNKIFATVATVFNLAMIPIWSAVTKASAEKNYTWIVKLYGKLRLLALLAIFFQLALIPFMQAFINLWLAENAITVNILYAAVFALFGSVFIWHSVIATIACGLGHLRLQFIFQTAGVVIKFALSLILMYFTHNWIVIILANFIALLPYGIAQTLWFHRFFKHKLSEERDRPPLSDPQTETPEERDISDVKIDIPIDSAMDINSKT